MSSASCSSSSKAKDDDLAGNKINAIMDEMKNEIPEILCIGLYLVKIEDERC